MEKKKRPLDCITLKINLSTWELIPKKIGRISWFDREFRSFTVHIYFLCFELYLLFTYK